VDPEEDWQVSRNPNDHKEAGLGNTKNVRKAEDDKS
jgi:hypothetical protein